MIEPATRTSPPRARRWAWPLAVGVAVVLTALITTALVPAGSRGRLDPRATDPEGSRAVASILRAHGIAVEVVERSDEAVEGADIRTTIVVTRPSLLGPAQLRRLAASPADLVLVEPDLVVLRALAPSVNPAGVLREADAGPAEPRCDDPDAVAAATVTGGGHLYVLRGAGGRTGRTVGCYPHAGRSDRFALVRLRGDGDRRITVLGQAAVVQNGQLAADGNAALALRVLGAHPSVRWYLPDPLELGTAGHPPSLTELLPPWVSSVFWQLVIVVVVALLWRGRRLGRVVAEPLPVIVRSAETVEGRARLYRQGHARGQAAALLRTASVRRLAARLGVPGAASPEDVAAVAATASGTDPGDVYSALLGEPPPDDVALVALAATLDDLEHAVAVTADGRHRYGDPAPEQPVDIGRDSSLDREGRR